MASYQEIIDLGTERELPPEQILEGLSKFRADVGTQIEASTADDDAKFQAGAKLGNDFLTAATKVRLGAVAKESERLLPITSERAAFWETLQKDPKLKGDDVPDRWRDTLTRLDEISKPLEVNNIGGGSPINFEGSVVGDYRIRDVDGKNLEAIVTGPEGKKSRFSVTYNKDQLLQNLDDERKAVIKEYNTSVGDTAPYDSRNLERVRFPQEELDELTAQKRISDRENVAQKFGRDRGAETIANQKLELINAEEDFVKRANTNGLARYSVRKQLPRVEGFTSQLPNSTLEALTTRPLLNVGASLAKAGAIGANALSSNPDVDFFGEVNDTVDRITPGVQGDRFTNPDGLNFVDAAGGGVESLITLLTPGLIAKGVTKATGAAASANAAGLGALAATDFSERYGGLLTDAYNESDPELAEKKLRYAPFMAAAGAAIGMGVEAIFPEQRIFGGLNIGTRLRSLIKAPFQEGIEEGITSLAYNATALATDAPVELEDALQNTIEGGVAGIPFGFIQAGRRHRRRSSATAEFHRALGIDGVAEAQSEVAKAAAEFIAENGPEAALVAMENGELLTELGARVTGISEKVPIESVLPFVAETLETMTTLPTSGDVVREKLNDTVDSESTDASVETAPTAPITTEPVVTETPDVETEAPVETTVPVIEKRTAQSELPEGGTTSSAAAVLTPEEQQEFRNMFEGREIPTLAAPTGFTGSVIDTLQRLTGRKILVVNNPTLGTDGRAAPSGNFSVINLASKQSIAKLAGHEVAHILEKTEGWEDVRASIRKSAAFQDYRRNLIVDQGYEENQVEREFIADITGESTRLRSFMAELRQENPGVFRRVGNRILDFLDQLWERLKGEVSRAEASPAVENIRQVREAVRDMLLSQDNNTETSPTGPSDSRNIPTKFVGTQKGFEDIPGLDLYNIDLPGSKADGTTFGVTQGAGPDEVQENARRKITEAGESIDSRNVEPGKARRRRFSGLLMEEMAKSIPMSKLIDIANNYVNTDTLRVNQESDIYDLLNKLTERDGPLQQSIAFQVRTEFAEHLRNVDDPAGEAAVIRAQVAQVMIGRIVEAAARFAARGSKAGIARSRKIFEAAKQAAYNATIDVPVNRYAAARILRSTQVTGENTETAAMLADFEDALAKFVQQKYAINAQEVAGVESRLTKLRSEAARDQETVAIVGDQVENLRATVKGAVRKVASWLGISSDSINIDEIDARFLNKQQRSVFDEIKRLIGLIENDYRGNIEPLLERLEDAVENFTGSNQTQMLLELRNATVADFKAAQLEFDTRKDSHRKYDAAARRFIASQEKDRKKVERSQESKDFAEIKKAVSEGLITPTEAAKGFLRLGGDKGLFKDLVAAFTTFVDNNKVTPETTNTDETSEDDETEDPLVERLEERSARMLRSALDERTKDKTGLSDSQYASRLLAEYVAGKPVSFEGLVDAYMAAGAVDRTAVEAALQDAFSARVLNLQKRTERAQRKYDAAVRKADKVAAERAQRALERAKTLERVARDRVEKSLVDMSENQIDRALDGFARPFPSDSPKKKTARQEAVKQARQTARDYAKAKPGITEDYLRQQLNAAGVRSHVADTVVKNLTDVRILALELRQEKAAKKFLATLDARDKKAAAADRAEAKRLKEKRDRYNKSIVEKAKTAANAAFGIKKGPRATVPTLEQFVRAQAGDYAAGENISEVDMRASLERMGISDLELEKTMAALNVARTASQDQQQADLNERLDKVAEAAITRNATKTTGKRGQPVAGSATEQSIPDSIWSILNNNPTLSTKDVNDQKKIVIQILEDRGFSRAEAVERADTVLAAFQDRLNKLIDAAKTDFQRRFSRGQVTEEVLRKVIRLSLLDPGSSIMDNLASAKGWVGLTPEQLNSLHDNAERASKVVDPQVRLSILLEQMRVINTVAGVNPPFADTLSSSIRASMYSGLGSLFTNITAPGLSAFVVAPIREFVESSVTRPQDVLKNLRSVIQSMYRALKTGALSAGIGFQYNATLGLSAAKDTAGDRQVGVLAIDALTQRADLAIDRLRSRTTPLFRKGWEAIVLAITSGRLVWKVLGALDSLGIAALTEFHTSTRLNKALIRAGVNPFREFNDFMNTSADGIRHAVEQLGLDPLRASKEMFTRTAEAFYQRDVVKDLGIDGFQFHAEARNEALTIMGNHSEVEGLTSRVGNAIADQLNNRWFLGLGSWLSGPVRIVSNIADAGMWWMPGVGLLRYGAEVYRIKNNQEQVFQLSAGNKWQLQRRLFESVYGTILGALFYSLFRLQPEKEEEKWFNYTGAYPSDPAERSRWAQEGLTEFTLYLGSKKSGQRFQLRTTRGALEFLTFPLVSSDVLADFTSGKRDALGTVKAGVFSASAVGLPGIYSMAKTVGIWATGNDSDARKGNPGTEDLQKELAFRGASLIPFSGLARSISRFDDNVPQRRTEANLWQTLFPAYAIWADDGKLILRNALGESPYEKESMWNLLSRLNLPVGFLDTKGTNNSGLDKIFSRMDYSLPPPVAYKTFLNGIKGREQAVLANSGVESLEDLYNDYVDRRAAAFKEIFFEDEEPDSGKDLRATSEIIDSGDTEAFKKRMSNLWRKANKAAKDELGITDEDED